LAFGYIRHFVIFFYTDAIPIFTIIGVGGSPAQTPQTDRKESGSNGNILSEGRGAQLSIQSF